MSQPNQQIQQTHRAEHRRKSAKHRTIINLTWWSGVLGVGSIALLSGLAVAQTTPRPGIFSEPPYTKVRPAATEPATPPTVEQRQTPDAKVTPINGAVSIRLVNKTVTTINYQVVGDTQQRTLAGQSEVTLQALQIPVDISFYRPDRGFLLTNSQVSTAMPDQLEITFTATADQDIGRTALTIPESGEVFLY